MLAQSAALALAFAPQRLSAWDNVSHTYLHKSKNTKRPVQTFCAGSLYLAVDDYLQVIGKDEIGGEFYQDEQRATAVAGVSAQASPNEKVEEVHGQAGQEDEHCPVNAVLQPQDVEPDG